MNAREEKLDRRKHSRVFHRTFSLIKYQGKCNSWLFILPTGSSVTGMVQLADSVYGQLGEKSNAIKKVKGEIYTLQLDGQRHQCNAKKCFQEAKRDYFCHIFRLRMYAYVRVWTVRPCMVWSKLS